MVYLESRNPPANKISWPGILQLGFQVVYHYSRSYILLIERYFINHSCPLNCIWKFFFHNDQIYPDPIYMFRTFSRILIFYSCIIIYLGKDCANFREQCSMRVWKIQGLTSNTFLQRNHSTGRQRSLKFMFQRIYSIWTPRYMFVIVYVQGICSIWMTRYIFLKVHVPNGLLNRNAILNVP